MFFSLDTFSMKVINELLSMLSVNILLSGLYLNALIASYLFFVKLNL